MNKKKDYPSALLIIASLFFIFGFLTWVNATLITFFKKAFDLSHTGSYLVTFASYLSYTVAALPASMMLRKSGFRNGMSIGLLIMAAGSLLFVPAARMASYPLFLVGLFTTGIGLTVLQTAANPYVTILGPISSAARRISFMGVSNKAAGIFSQVLFGGLLLSGAAYAEPLQELNKVVVPYLVLFAVFVVLAGLLKKLSKNLPEVREEDNVVDQSDTGGKSIKKMSVFQYPNLVLGVLALFCAEGLEVIVIDTVINYGISLGFPEEKAMVFGAYALAAMMLGYVLGVVLIPKYLSQQAFLKLSAFLGVILTLLAVSTTGFTSVLFLTGMGLANAILWPAIWPLSLHGLGTHTKTGAALLIMGVCGGAILPLGYGYLADLFGSTQQAYWILVPLYAYVLYFGFAGHRKRSW